MAILAGATVIAAVGVVDDVFDLPPAVKLVGQIAAAIIPVSVGVTVDEFSFPFVGGLDPGSVKLFELPLVDKVDLGEVATVIGIVAMVNVINFIDGVDGLAAGVCVIAAASLAVIALSLDRTAAGILAALTAGAALGFLRHGFPPASSFMGDTGSNLLGYLLAIVAVQGALKTNAVVALFLPLLVLAVPILDSSFVIAKRLKYRQPIYVGDRSHFHHRMANIGFSQRRTLAYLYGWALIMAGLALALRFVPYSDDHGNFDFVWTAVMVLCGLVAIAASVYLVFVARDPQAAPLPPATAARARRGRGAGRGRGRRGGRPRARDGQLRGGQPRDRRDRHGRPRDRRVRGCRARARLGLNLPRHDADRHTTDGNAGDRPCTEAGSPLRSLTTKTRIPVLILLGLVGVGILLHGLHTAAGPGGARSEDFFNEFVYLSVLVLSSLVCLLRGVSNVRERWAWIAFGLGLGLWAAGDLFWSAAPDHYPSTADYLYLAGYPALYAGIVLLVRARVQRFGSSMWLDGAIGALAAAALATALLHPVLAGLGAPDTTETLVDLAYPVGDILLLSFVIGAIAIVGVAAGRRDWLLIAGGLIVSGIADGAYLYLNATSGYVEGTLLDTLWMVAAGLIALAAWTGAGRSAWSEANVNRSLFFPSLFAIIAVALQVHDLTRPLSPLSAGLATATLAVVVLRLFVAFSENSRLLGTVRRDSVTDSLTGLGNRRKLLTDLQESLDSGGSAEGTAFAIFDLDGFKAYNDTYGHGAGDLLLNRLGRSLAAAVKPFGSAYRLGGDEFCVIVSAEGDVKLDSILAAASTALSEGGEGFSITCSRGAVRIPHEAHKPTQTLRLADRRMYAEKGRRSTPPAARRETS